MAGSSRCTPTGGFFFWYFWRVLIVFFDFGSLFEGIWSRTSSGTVL